jgi:hypothetical protein
MTDGSYDHNCSIKIKIKYFCFLREKSKQTLRFLTFNVLSAAFRNASKSSSSSSSSLLFGGLATEYEE